MTRSQEMTDLLDSRVPRPLVPGKPGDDALLALLVHMAFSDGVVRNEELAFLARILPGRSKQALAEWVARVVAVPLDLEAIKRALPHEDDRWKVLRYATRMALQDGFLAPEERDMLIRLSEAMTLPSGAVVRVIEEVSERRTRVVDVARIQQALAALGWDAVQFAEGEVASPDLSPLVPEGAVVVRRVGLDKVEMMGIYREGIVARFQEGPAFLHWEEIVAVTHGQELSSPVRLHTEDGNTWSFVDRRMNGVSMLLDRIYADARKPSAPPKVERVRGDAG